MQSLLCGPPQDSGINSRITELAGKLGTPFQKEGGCSFVCFLNNHWKYLQATNSFEFEEFIQWLNMVVTAYPNTKYIYFLSKMFCNVFLQKY